MARLWETSLLWDEWRTMSLPLVSSPGSQNRSADFEQARVALIAAARRLSAPRLRAFDLLLADEGSRSTKPLVLDYRALRGMAELVEGAVGEFDAFVADR